MSPEEIGFNPMEGAPSTQEEEGEAGESSEEMEPIEAEEASSEENEEQESDNLPSPNDLGVDLTVNPQR